MKVAAIARAPGNSPGMADKDYAILQSVAQALQQLGVTVEIFTEEQYDADKTYSAIYHMSRNNRILNLLAAAEKPGCHIINTPAGVRNCSRHISIKLMQEQHIPQPVTAELTTESDPPEEGYPVWIKKGEGWACQKEDVCFANDKREATEILSAFRSRNIEKVIYSRHVKGDIIKFYGVTESYFQWHYPNPENSKFGFEHINGAASHYRFDVTELKKTAFMAAKAIGIEIFGGDCIVEADGAIKIIDLNDFPSFSYCRDEAAQAIAKHIYLKLQKEDE